MAKVTGLAVTTLSVGDTAGPNAATDIRNDVLDFTFATPRATFDVTGVDKSAIERLLGLADFSCSLHMGYNPSGQHVIFSTVSSTSVNRCLLLTMSGKNLNLGATGAGNGAVLFTDYQWVRTAAGEATTTAPGVLANGSVPTWS